MGTGEPEAAAAAPFPLSTPGMRRGSIMGPPGMRSGCRGGRGLSWPLDCVVVVVDVNPVGSFALGFVGRIAGGIASRGSGVGIIPGEATVLARPVPRKGTLFSAPTGPTGASRAPRVLSRVLTRMLSRVLTRVLSRVKLSRVLTLARPARKSPLNSWGRRDVAREVGGRETNGGERKETAGAHE